MLERVWRKGNSLTLLVGMQTSTATMENSVEISQNLGIELPYASLVAQWLKRLPGMQETQVRSLGREDPLEKEMPTHSSILAWRIPWRREPGRLQSTGSQRVGHDWATSLSLFPFMHWRRQWQPTPVFLPGESQGQRSLVGCHLWGRTKLDTTEAT